MGANAASCSFVVDLKAHRVVWGWRDGLALAGELEHNGIRRFMLLASSRRAEQFSTLIGSEIVARRSGVFAEITPHVPQHSVDAACEAASRCDADALVVFGGGSALDTAKAVGHRIGLPIIAIPTNFSGSEVTWNYGLTVGGSKRTMREPSVLPRAVIYEPSLAGTMTLSVAVCSGINAIAHAIEALYAPEANPLTQSLADAGIASMVAGLREWAETGFSAHAGMSCLQGAWLCGEALSQVGMGLHHRICHVLGGTYGLPHAATHTLMLPYLISFNVPHALALSRLDKLFDGAPFAKSLAEFATTHGAPVSLASLGLPEQELARVANLALDTPVANPRPITTIELEVVLKRAWRGELAEVH